MVQSQCGTTLDVSKVETAMFFLFGQDYRSRQADSSSRWTGGKGHSYRWTRKNHAYAAYDDRNGENYEHFLEEAHTLRMKRPLTMTTKCLKMRHHGLMKKANLLLRPMMRAMMTMTTTRCMPPIARRRFADIRAARGYWPVVALPPSGGPGSGPTSSTPMSSIDQKAKEKDQKGRAAKDNDLSTRRAQRQQELKQHRSA